MSLSIEVQKKQKYSKKIQLRIPSEVFDLDQVKEIRDAIQEHLLFIGLDRRNNIRNMSLIGIGTSGEINVDDKSIVRTALINACDRVILVHNHPSNNLDPSNHDITMTNTINKLLHVFNIKLLDHIIVTENDYVSMLELNAIDEKYENDRTKLLDNALLIKENNSLKCQVTNLNKKLEKYIKIEQEDENEFE